MTQDKQNALLFFHVKFLGNYQQTAIYCACTLYWLHSFGGANVLTLNAKGPYDSFCLILRRALVSVLPFSFVRKQPCFRREDIKAPSTTCKSYFYLQTILKCQDSVVISCLFVILPSLSWQKEKQKLRKCTQSNFETNFGCLKGYTNHQGQEDQQTTFLGVHS